MEASGAGGQHVDNSKDVESDWKTDVMTILANFQVASLSYASAGVPITTILPESKKRATDLGFTRRMMARPLGLYSVFLVFQVMRSRSRRHPSLQAVDMFCGKRVY